MPFLTLSPICALKTLKLQWDHLYKHNKLVTGIIYKFRKQVKYEKKNKHPRRRWKLSFSLQGGLCLWAVLPAWAHVSFPQGSEWGTQEITRVPQTLCTAWKLWSTTNFTKSRPLLKVNIEVVMPVGGMAESRSQSQPSIRITWSLFNRHPQNF